MANYNKTVLGKNNGKKAKTGNSKYLIAYTKKVGGKNIVTIFGNSAANALQNAKNAIKSGNSFYVMKKL